MTLTIRPATTADVSDLVALNAEIQALHHQALPKLFKPAGPACADLFVQLLSEAANVFVLAVAEDGVAGYLYGEKRERAETAFTYANRALYIHHLGVKAGHRRQGVGRALIEAARRLAAEQDISRIEVDFWAFNDEAREFYAAQGFEPATERWWRL